MYGRSDRRCVGFNWRRLLGWQRRCLDWLGKWFDRWRLHGRWHVRQRRHLSVGWQKLFASHCRRLWRLVSVWRGKVT